MTELSTDRLLLRRAQRGDLLDIHKIYGDAATMQYWSTPPDADIEASRARLNGLIACSSPLTYFAMEHAGRVIGTIGIHDGDEIGFILARDHWRQGFVTEAATRLWPYYFDTLDYAQVTADVDPLNTASCACLLSLGFVETGRAKNTFEINGVASDSIYFTKGRPT